MVLTAYFVLSPVTNSSCHRRRRIKVRRNPDHTTWPYAATSTIASARHVRQTETLLKALKHRSSTRGPIAHRPKGPPCDAISRTTLPRPSPPVPNVRDDRDTPLCGTGWRGYEGDLGQSRSGLFLREGVDGWNRVGRTRELVSSCDSIAQARPRSSAPLPRPSHCQRP